MKPLVTPRKIYGRSNFQKFVSSEVCFWKFWKIHNLFFKICDFFVFVLQNKDNMNMGAKRPKILVYILYIYLYTLLVCLYSINVKTAEPIWGRFKDDRIFKHLPFTTFIFRQIFYKIRDIFLFFVNMSNLGNTGFQS